MLNESFAYKNNTLYCDSIAVAEIATQVGTPVYIYSLKRVLANLNRLKAAFHDIQPHIHYSAKANANLTILRTLIHAGVGIDAVSGGEIFLALRAGAKAENIVFAGVGKSPSELRYALEQGVGWFNVENVRECQLINDIAAELGTSAQIALRLNPEVTANTHPYIATGHGGAKFGLTAEVISGLLAHRKEYPHLRFAGIHVHIGSQLHDTEGTVKAVEIALELIAPYSDIRTVNIGGGLPVGYQMKEALPEWKSFAEALAPLLQGYDVLLEPGRSIIADAGILVSEILYVKQQAGEIFYIVDASMTELIRPALYGAHHEIVPLKQSNGDLHPVNIVGPVCETADVLGKAVLLPEMQPSDLLAVLTSGAYGMVMASNYNARPRPPEVMVSEDGASWSITRSRETWDDLVRLES